jgi:hypothetical protein
MQKPLVVSLAAVVAAAGLAFADDGGAERLIVPRAQCLSASEVTQSAVQDYQVHAIEVDDGTYEFEAANSATVRTTGHAHPATGAVVPHVFLCCRSCIAERLNVPRARWLSTSEVTQKLVLQGYQVHEIEVDDGAYEFEATTSAGAKIEGHAHPATGEVLLRSVLCCDRCLAI